jgi:Bacterial regulatory proteins, tetR family
VMETSPAKTRNLREECAREALAIIEEGGLEALSLREVARRLGVSHQALTNIFPVATIFWPRSSVGPLPGSLTISTPVCQAGIRARIWPLWDAPIWPMLWNIRCIAG